MNLQRVDRLSNYDSETLKLYCPVRDEISLVKVFLDYHRHIGIKLFVFLDNGSVDGTLEYLKKNKILDIYDSCLIPNSFTRKIHCQKLSKKFQN